MPKKVKLEDGSEIEVFTQEDVDSAVEEKNKALDANHQKLLRQHKSLKTDLDNLKSVLGDMDPEEVKTALEAKAEAERKAAEAAGDWEAREKQLTTTHQKERTALEAKIGKMDKTVRSALVTAKLTAAIAEAKGDTNLLLPHAEQYVDVRETDDGFEAFVVDADGTQKYDSDGKPMSFSKLVESELVPKFPRAFEGTGSSGSGTSKSAGGAGGSDVKTIPDGDNQAFLSNVDDIASGKAEVAVR